ncbi:hypothetical protein [Ensifer sp. MJa1]|uniref:hypothetical protein n=1 Tax=Ensifer sp. MJa1 TaxID=2919888 RepID=UPI00300A196D
MKFLIDQCLSPELAKIAIEKGHGETSHVVWMKLGGLKSCVERQNRSRWVDCGSGCRCEVKGQWLPTTDCISSG